MTKPTDILQPQLISGCLKWGKWGKQLSTDQMNSLIEKLIDLDINFFDHADIYGDYTTEEEFGKAIVISNLKREQYQICTKLGIQLPNGERNDFLIKKQFKKQIS